MNRIEISNIGKRLVAKFDFDSLDVAYQYFSDDHIDSGTDADFCTEDDRYFFDHYFDRWLDHDTVSGIYYDADQ